MEAIEFFSMLGFPARLAGRMPVIARYLTGPPKALTSTSKYARERYGKTFKYRLWLSLDIAELEQLEQLINDRSDEEVLQFRHAQLASGGMNTVVGSLLAAACTTMLTLNSLSNVNLIVRAVITVSLMLSLMSVYFTLVQLRELSQPTSAQTLRDWLWNGRYRPRKPPARDPEKGSAESSPRLKESSLTANILLQAPFELLSIAISLFLGGIATYLGLAMKEDVILGTGDRPNNKAVLVTFVVCTAFTLLVFGQALGQKDRERERCERVQAAAEMAEVAGQHASAEP